MKDRDARKRILKLEELIRKDITLENLTLDDCPKCKHKALWHKYPGSKKNFECRKEGYFIILIPGTRQCLTCGTKQTLVKGEDKWVTDKKEVK